MAKEGGAAGGEGDGSMRSSRRPVSAARKKVDQNPSKAPMSPREGAHVVL